MIKISPNDWHYKLIKYTFGIEGKELSNLCPYFWLLVASLFICPLAFLHKSIIMPIVDYSNTISTTLSDKMYNDLLKSIKRDDIELLVYAIEYTPLWYDDVKLSKILPSKVISKSKINGTTSVYEDWCKSNNTQLHNIKNKYTYDEFVNIAGGLSLFKGNYQTYNKKNSDDKKKAVKISNNTKKVFIILINLISTIVIWSVFFLFSSMLTLIFSEFILSILDVPYFSIGLLCVIVLAVILGLFGKYLYLSTVNIGNSLVHFKIPNNNSIGKLILYFIPSMIYIAIYYGVYKLILYPFFKGVWTVLTESFDIFGEYLKSAYSDYCPGIEWEDENKN